MRGKWARCANCGKATWYCAKHGCKPVVAKTKRRAALTAPATKETTMETINLTPKGMETPEGVERVNKAVDAQTNAIVVVANVATAFLSTWGFLLDNAIRYGAEGESLAEDLKELREAIAQRAQAQEAFLKAIAGR